MTAAACGSYTWTTGNGLTYTSSGAYDYITTGTNGCADTVTLNLTINNGSHTSITAAACGSYLWNVNNQTYTASGAYDYITTDANGCAYTVTLNLTINNGSHTSVSAAACGSYLWNLNNQTYTASGAYDYITTGANGCADTVTLNLTINNGSHTSVTAVACGTYLWNVNNQT